jgi:glycosyltransferase involved in cell wall biosynthesis
VGGDAAVWFDPYDDADIAAALTLVATDRRRLEGAAVAGLAQAEQFTWARVADETLEVFSRALEGSRAQRVPGQDGQ